MQLTSEQYEAQARPTDEELEAADEVGRAMSRLFRAAARAKAQDAATGGDHHSLPLLITLRELGPLRANELADAVCTDPSTVSRQVAALVDRGYVLRRPDPEDGRAARLELSPAGSTVLAERLLARQHRLAAMLAAWPMSQRRQLAKLLDRFADDFAASVAVGSSPRPDHADSENT